MYAAATAGESTVATAATRSSLVRMAEQPACTMSVRSLAPSTSSSRLRSLPATSTDLFSTSRRAVSVLAGCTAEYL